ncbi:hypothetical protein [Klebsiella oxytoca]|uniref:hypothetical protein n=1 Tax=Klebsiella oxytoca TaxID=571 RepID=UPI00143D72AF|nr:hypothetical protein [Klebsiella oxytoca]
MIYTDFMNTKNVEQGSAVTPSGHPGADYYQKCHFFVLLDSNVLADCIEFLIAQSIEFFNPRQNKVLMV